MRKTIKNILNLRKSVAYDLENKGKRKQNVDFTKNIALNKIYKFKTIGARRNISNSNNDRAINSCLQSTMKAKQIVKKVWRKWRYLKRRLVKLDNELDSV